MKHLLFKALWAALLSAAIYHPAQAQEFLADDVTEGLAAYHWSRTDARLLAQAQEVSFALHEANGTLPDRLTMLARFAGHGDIQRAISDHPAYLDLFLNLRDAPGFVATLYRFGGGWQDREALLEATLLDPSPEGIARFERAVLDYGGEMAHLVHAPSFPDLVANIGWYARDGASADFRDWLHSMLRDLPAGRVDEIVELLFLQGSTLRQQFRLTERWARLERARQRNPRLTEILLGHRGVWEWLDDDRLIEAVNGQLAYFDEDKALSFVALVLGGDGLVVEAWAQDDWRAPLPHDRAAFMIDTAAREPDSALVDLAFAFRNDGLYWDFATDDARARFVNCLLQEAGANLDSIRNLFTLGPGRVSATCNPESSLNPLRGLMQAGRILLSGEPLELGEMADAGFDLWILVRLIYPPTRLESARTLAARMAPRVGATILGAISRKGAARLTVREARNVLSAQAAIRVTLRAAQPGIARLSGFTSPREFAQAVTRDAVFVARACYQRSGVSQGEAAVSELICNVQENAGIDTITNAFSTEYIRCAQLPHLRADDAICQALFPPVTDEETAP